MADESFGPMTDAEAQQFAAKLGQLSAGLTPKERWFLSEVLARGVEGGPIDSEVEGYTVGGTVFFPTGMGSTFGVSTVQTSKAMYHKFDGP